MRSALRHFAAGITLRAHPRVSRERILQYQIQQLRRLVVHAYDNVPYYRRLFDRHNLKPHDIRSLADLQAIPISGKNDLRSLPEADIVARGIDVRRLLAFHTSGSSGEPFTIRRTPLEQRLLRVLRVRAMRDMGLRFIDSIALVALIRPTLSHLQPPALRVLQQLDPRRRTEIDCRLPLDDITRMLLAFRPKVIIGPAGVLSQVAQRISDVDRAGTRPRFVQVDSEVLTPLMRRQIQGGFAAPVFEFYDSWEFNLLAWECPATGELHTCDDGLILEVLKDGSPAAEGERGEVIGANLHAYAMPFIRYRLGDIVTRGRGTCACGQPFSTIRAVQGRMIDYFPLPDGREVHPYEITQFLAPDSVSWLRQYQLVQERKDRIVLRVVASRDPSHEEISSLSSTVSNRLGPGVEFQLQLVPEIQSEPNGKFRVSRSLVRSAYDGIDWEGKKGR